MNKRKKNGYLMNAIDPYAYFAIIMIWLLGPLLLGFLGAVLTSTALLIGGILLISAAVWFVLEGVLLDYFNRFVPDAGSPNHQSSPEDIDTTSPKERPKERHRKMQRRMDELQEKYGRGDC